MADSQRVIEFLRDVRQGGLANLQAANAEVAQMANDYAALCGQANDRLRQCSGFLQQGLRSEAIHLAEQNPNLLDLVSQLDLPDPQAWTEFCQNNNLPVPPPLQFDRAAQLNDAYAQEQPLDHLLARHRLLALSRAPVRDRLAIMRKIADIDTTTAHWDKDLREFEVARLKELPGEFHTAVKRHDDASLVALMDEVNRQKWCEAPPASLANAVTEAYTRLQRTAVEAELQKLVEPMREAFAARSFQECQALVARWRHTMTSAGVTHVAAELMDEMKPVAAFVNEEMKREEQIKRFSEACRAFTRLLDADAADAQLEAGYARLKEFGQEIPEDLVRRYMAKKAGRRQVADRSHKSRLMLIGGTSLAIIVVGLVITWLATRGANANSWARRINDAVAKHSKAGLDEGQKTVDQLNQTNAGLKNEANVANAISALARLHGQYEADGKAIAEHVAALAAAQKAAADALARPDASLNDLRGPAATLDETLGRANAAAGDLAWADSDHALTGAVADATSTWKAAQERVLAAFRKDLATVTTDLDAVPATASSPDAAARVQAQLAALAARADTLRTMPLLDEEAKTSLAALAARLKDRQSGSAATGDVAAELERVRNANGSAAELKGALEAFISRFPDDSHDADFKAALNAIPPAQALEAWRQLAGSFDGKLAVTSQAMAQKRAGDMDAFLTAHPNNPKDADAAAYAQYLHAAAEALAEHGTWQTAMADLLSNPLLNELQVVELSNGERYYTRGDIKRTEKRLGKDVSVSFDYIDADAIEHPDPKNPAKSFAKRKSIEIKAPVTVPAKPSPAPHAKLMAEMTDDLKLINESNWDTYGIDLADRIINDTQIDLVVKSIFLEQILKTQRTLTPGFAGIGDAYDRALSDFARQTPADLFWFDPSKISDGTRRSLTQIIAAIPRASALKPRLAEARNALFNGIANTTYTAGVLMKDDAGAWALRTHASLEMPTPLWAVAWPPGSAIVPEKSPTTLVQIGTATAGKVTLDAARGSGVVQGTIVYIAQTASHP